MAPRQPGIQELRTRLEASRWQLYDSVQRIGEGINIPRRLRSDLADHPIKWAAVSVGAGVVAAQILPWLLRRKGRSWAASILLPAIRTAGVAVIPMIVEAATHYLRSSPTRSVSSHPDNRP